MRIHRLAVATAVTAALGLSVPLAAAAAPGLAHHPQGGSRTAHHAPKAHRAHKAHKARPSHAALFGLSDHWESAVEADDRQLAARPGIVGAFLSWSRPDMPLDTEVRMLIQYATWANSRGAVPMVDLSPPTTVQLASIANGSQDSILAAYAKALHKWNRPFLLRLFPEMNGPWESYAPGSNGNTSAQLVAAWRHVYRLFHHYGATKVKFVWNPDKVFKNEAASLRSVWPGRNYVDWVGLDIYDNASKATATKGSKAGTTFPNARAAAAHSVRAVRSLTKYKPLIVAEIGAANTASKPQWIKTAVSGLSNLGVKAVVWFNEKGSANWRLDSSKAALRATKQTLHSSSVVWPGHNGGTLARDNRLILSGHW